MSAPRLVLASHNQGKLRELRAMILQAMPGANVEELVVDASAVGASDVKETGVSFEENARLKAESIARETGIAALADDSGLSVDVMGGSPGFLSARWAGEHGNDRANLELLLEQMADIEQSQRGCAFECVAALSVPGSETVTTSGTMRGTLLQAPVGEGGFGYDPIMAPEGQTRSCAQLSAEEKNELSHRGQAMKSMIPRIVELLSR